MKNRQIQTLLQFAVNGPMNVYQVWHSIPKKDRGSRSSYQKAVSFLAKMGFITVKESKLWFGGRSQKVYQLTIKGFLKVLKENTAWQNIDKIIDSNKEILPDYFELWDSIKQFNVKGVAIKLLKYAAQTLEYGLPSFPEKIENQRPTLKDWLPRLAIFPYNALLDGVVNQEDAERWHQMLLEIPRAEKLYVSTLEWMMKSHKSAAETFSRALETHHKLKYWSENVKQVAEIIKRIKNPAKRLRALKQNKELWQAVLQLYPEVKNEKRLLALLEKQRCEKFRGDVGEK